MYQQCRMQEDLESMKPILYKNLAFSSEFLNLC